MRVILYKLYFLSSFFSLNQIKEFSISQLLYFSIFFSIFYPLTLIHCVLSKLFFYSNGQRNKTHGKSCFPTPPHEGHGFGKQQITLQIRGQLDLGGGPREPEPLLGPFCFFIFVVGPLPKP